MVSPHFPFIKQDQYYEGFVQILLAESDEGYKCKFMTVCFTEEYRSKISVMESHVVKSHWRLYHLCNPFVE